MDILQNFAVNLEKILPLETLKLRELLREKQRLSTQYCPVKSITIFVYVCALLGFCHKKITLFFLKEEKYFVRQLTGLKSEGKMI